MKRKTAQQMRDAMVRHVRRIIANARLFDDIFTTTLDEEIDKLPPSFWSFSATIRDAPSVATATFAEYYDTTALTKRKEAALNDLDQKVDDILGESDLNLMRRRKKPIVHEPTWRKP